MLRGGSTKSSVSRLQRGKKQKLGRVDPGEKKQKEKGQGRGEAQYRVV